MNADDVLSTDGWLNDQPETHPVYEDRVFGGAGLDILIGNTGGDRLIDWVGEFNSYIVPSRRSASRRSAVKCRRSSSTSSMPKPSATALTSPAPPIPEASMVATNTAMCRNSRAVSKAKSG